MNAADTRMAPRELLKGVLAGREPASTVVDWAKLSIEEPADLLALLPGEVPFATSGSTGPPEVWLRGRGQLVAETVALARSLADTEPDAFVIHAPLHHLYGMLFGALLPALLGGPHTTRARSTLCPGSTDGCFSSPYRRRGGAWTGLQRNWPGTKTSWSRTAPDGCQPQPAACGNDCPTSDCSMCTARPRPEWSAHA